MNKLVVCVGSQNPVKIEAARGAFEKCFDQHIIEIISMDAASQVAEQPMCTKDTLSGAINRVQACKLAHMADYYISFEGGVDVIDGVPSTYAVVCISDGTNISNGRTGTLPLPTLIYKALKQGSELGPEMDALFNTHNIKHKGGAIGQLTKGLCTRKSIYEAGTIMTLAPFIHPNFINLFLHCTLS